MIKDKHQSTHHIIPRSRIPKEFKKLKRPWNTKKKIIEEHRAWHNFLFGNRLPCEAIKMIEEKQIKRGDKWEEGWKIVFGNASPKEAIEIIKKYWVLPECFHFKECVRFEIHNKICPLLIRKIKGEGKLSPFKFFIIRYNN